MASDSEDTDGEELQLIRPGLIRELQNVLDEYPDDGQILKEMIQNAEDAGARCVQILTDRRHFHRDLDNKTRRKHPHLAFLQAPSLCVYNDAEFTDRDWEGIRMLHTSIKEKDPLKVGRFGLGFKSVFHLTDRLVILSGDFLMYMDPFKGEDRYCKKKRLSRLKGRELQSVLHCVGGVFGMSRETIQDGHFPGTMFWFPLRQSPSDLSCTVYTQDKVGDLVNAFKAEARSILLFLKNMERVEVFSRDGSQTQEEVFTVEIAASCRETVRAERKKFIKALHDAGGELPSRDVNCVTEMTIETSDHLAPSHNRDHWLVVSYHPGQGEVSQELAGLCADPELSYRPHVGAAIPLPNNQRGFKSQIFCFLPLPLHTRSPTGLPLHVNGYFALSQNRRHLKWPTEDQMRNQAQLEASVRWNCLLVKELIPRVYTRLLSKLKEFHWKNPGVFYAAWPDIDDVDDMWRPLVEPLYRSLAAVSSANFYTKVNGGEWVELRSVVLPLFHQDVSHEVAEAVMKFYTVANKNIVELPAHVKKGLEDFGLLENAQTVDPRCVSDLLGVYVSEFTHGEKLLLFQYLCCSDNVSELLLDKPLLPLTDGTFGTFRKKGSGSPVTFWCTKDMASLFPGLESQFCDVNVSKEIWQHLGDIAYAGKLSVSPLSKHDSSIPDLINSSLHTRFGGLQPSLSPQDLWIRQIWQFLSSTEPWCRDLSLLKHLTLLPCLTGSTLTLFPLNGLYVCSAACGFRPLDKDLEASLRKLLITVLPELPDYVTHKHVLGNVVQYPSQDGILSALGTLTLDTKLRTKAIKKFNTCHFAAEKEAVVKFLAESTLCLDSILSLVCQLKIFMITTGDFTSVQDVQHIVPECRLPFYPPRPLLWCSGVSKIAATRLGARQLTLNEIAYEILNLMQPVNHFTTEQTFTFLKYILSSRDLLENQGILKAARQVRFLPTEGGRLCKPDDLYDPSCPLLSGLFLAADKLPHTEQVMPDMLKKLKTLGLRGANEVKPADLVAAAQGVEQMFQNQQIEFAAKKALCLWAYLCTYGTTIKAETLKEISRLHCLPCLQQNEKPDIYPRSLPLKSDPLIVKPTDMCHQSLITLLGSAMPVLKQNLPEQVIHMLQITAKPDVRRVLVHLQNVLLHFRQDEIPQYRTILVDIFKCLQSHSSEQEVKQALQNCQCVLTEAGDHFVSLNRFWIDREYADLDLKPYRFPLPLEMSPAGDMFIQFGSSQRQDEQLLQKVMDEIRDNHGQQTLSQTQILRDMQLIKQILNVMRTSAVASKGIVLLPVEHVEGSPLKFKPAKECTVQTGKYQPQTLFHPSNDDEIFFVHPDIPVATALDLGALELKERTLTGVEALDFGYGQHEELTTRLNNLLSESYTDGFSVPKELIQNADDAGATEIRFLLDERENREARSNLISDEMASLQGPAVWVFNDATFTDEDFENITKLGAGTKKEDASKVGRFGLGFNSVYNLTDVPSFISRHTMAMFDPHIKYLPRGVGLKLDFRQPVNRSLLSRMPQQFQPFQGIFGCRLQNIEGVSYDGTLFRFPLRTSDQAAKSRIKGESYSHDKRREFLRMLLERAGSLLMFTQSVKKLQVFHLDSSCTDPSQALCLLTVTKTSQCQVLNPLALAGSVDSTILLYCTEHWPAANDIKVLEDVNIDVEVSEKSEVVCGVKAHHSKARWKLAWATGTEEAAQAAQRPEYKGLVPLATVAVLLEQNCILSLGDSPPGFYKSGHLFCFLPLPEEMVATTLPVHVNGTFALTSSRRSLLVQTEDDLSSAGFNWNAALFSDAVSKAYLLILETLLQETFEDFKAYFCLWPTSGDENLGWSFYRHLVSDSNRVFPVAGQRKSVAFNKAWFLEPEFMDSENGLLAWNALQQLLKKDGHLVDVPARICRQIKKGGQLKAFTERVITTEAFYKDIFFPNFHFEFWSHEERDRLTLYALSFFLDSGRFAASQFLLLITKGAKFVPTVHGNFQRPEDLYDPSSDILKELFHNEDVFPSHHFRQGAVLQKLKDLGMRSEMNVKPTDIVGVAKRIEMLYLSGHAEALDKAEGLWKLLVHRGQYLCAETLGQLEKIQCLPCLQQHEKPSSFPLSLLLKCENFLVSPSSLCRFENIRLAGCVLPVCRQDLPETVASKLGIEKQPRSGDILAHLKMAVKELDPSELTLYRLIEEAIFTALEQNILDAFVIQELQQKKCVLVESGEFVCPGNFWINRSERDIDLKPYRFPLPTELKRAATLFSQCGSAKHQDENLLQKILVEIRDKHEHQPLPQEAFHRDLLLVKQILDVLKNAGSLLKGTVLLPVEHDDKCVLKFKQASHCTFGTRPWQGGNAVDDEIFYVHSEINNNTAKAFGALEIRERALTGVEGLDFGYEQREELTTRIHNLLKDSYTDGFSVPKELLQNADDAGASEVRFLLDERENKDARSNLISDNMASLQGPAIWAFNDATFTDTDFENIIKLGAGTKKEDASKVGRFGLGFNSVYNLTDAPSFISRHTMAMFDPHVKYLPGGAGLKLDFRRPVNRSLLSRMPEQFQPFQDIFGCRLKKDGDIFYAGTLFRFPLRSEEQAAQSKLKDESYSQDKRREFLTLLLRRAGSLLMFTQNVKKLQVFFLPSDCLDPLQVQCLLSVTKTSCHQILHPCVGPLHGNILQVCTKQWPTVTNIQILENVCIDMEVFDRANTVCGAQNGHVTTHWKLAWATGTGASAEAAQQHAQAGLVPLSAVAAQLKESVIMLPGQSPSGFYTSGHLFCFLPLPEEMVHMSLQVHINGTFALASSRRNLIVKTEDDISSFESEWNSVLFGDAVSSAYLLLLENLHTEACAPYDRYFELFPNSGQVSLDKTFYKRLLGDKNKVFPVLDQNTWVAFQDAWFFDPVLRESECRQLAWDATKRFWNRDGQLVEVPTRVCDLIKNNGQYDAFQKRVITLKTFFTSFFFPNVSSNLWIHTDRDKLVLHALLLDDSEINTLLADCSCIPCHGSKVLKRPCELIHPNGAASKLYLTQDGRFPQKADGHDQHDVNFCQHKILNRLQNLGMISEDLPWEMVVERATSVSSMVMNDRASALERIVNLIGYLSSLKGLLFRINTCPQNVMEVLSTTRFLPVLTRPENWPFSWAAENTEQLSAPKELFLDSMEKLVACNAKLLDSARLKSFTVSSHSQARVLGCLGLRTEESTEDETLLSLAIDQLLAVEEFYRADNTIEKKSIQEVCFRVYQYLTKVLRGSDCEETRKYIANRLSRSKAVWTGTMFVSSTKAAFTCFFDCSPFLFKIEDAQRQYKPFFKLIGVKETFDARDVLWVLNKIHCENGGQQLTTETIGVVSRAAQLLCAVSEKDRSVQWEHHDVFLPDRHGYMLPTNNLCLDDCPWVTETDTMKFVHDAIPPETAKVLGVETKRGKDFDQLMLPTEFGQSEKLTTRIKRLLESYTFDSSLFKELLQNADDAGASEIRFILDLRCLGKKRVPEGWSEHLQGPALCVYNNKSFTSKDMEGIQNLGQGSKAEDLLKIGRYGVGFNAVYHITDVPSFWTRENDEQEVICVLDPNCRYVRNTFSSKPGVKLGNVERIRQVYPDMFAGYLPKFFDASKSGTMFRFPLRTDAMSQTSDLKDKPVTFDEIKQQLQAFKSEMVNCLLFLNSLQKIEIYSVNTDGTVKQEYKVEKRFHEKSCAQLQDFRKCLQSLSQGIANGTVGLRDVHDFEFVLHMNFTDSNDKDEEWMTVSRVGFADTGSLSEELMNEWHEKHFRLLPRGGVAVKVSEKLKERRIMPTLGHLAFCVLPLPILTNMPMHVNGHFALDHETRRNLWDNNEDARSQWNTATSLQLIVPAYITAIQQLKTLLFPDDDVLDTRLHHYHSLFPNPENARTSFWKSLAKAFYSQISNRELALFPVLHTNTPSLEWVPAFKQNGFYGYFSDLTNFFMKQREPQQYRPIILSQGVVARGSHQVQESDRNKATRLQTLLKELNMKVLEMPYRVYKYFITSGVKGVQEVTPASVIHFLKSAGSGRSGACNVSNLPLPVSRTSLKSTDNVQFLIEYLQNDGNFKQQLRGLPLSLRQSMQLYVFSDNLGADCPIVSEFVRLLLGSADSFLHEDIYAYFEPITQETQGLLRELNIPTLAQLLPRTLPEASFRTGQPCVLAGDHRQWVSDFWKFLESQFRFHREMNETQMRQEIENALRCLFEWSLIPVKTKAKISMLYPLRDMHSIVYLTPTEDQSNSRMWSVLKTLPLALLQTTLLPRGSVAIKLVASLNHPLALLRALALCGTGLDAIVRHCYTILSYLCNNLSVLEASCRQDELHQLLKRLPFYTAVDGTVIEIAAPLKVFCLNQTIPQEGLMEWSLRRTEPVHLLRLECIPKELCKFLGFSMPSLAEFYKRLLSTFDALPDAAVHIHITHLKIKLNEFDLAEKKSLTVLLKNTRFILTGDQRHTASEFYKAQEPVFKAMLPESAFPPPPYCHLGWVSFMEMAGIESEVTAEKFLEFARLLESQGQTRLTESIQMKSDVLVQHLFQRKTSDSLLNQVWTIRFVRPSAWVTTEEGQLLAETVQPFWHRPLISFSESCREDDLYLVWSSSCILHPNAGPLKHTMADHLSLQKTPPVDKVIAHVKNLCRALASDTEKLASLINFQDLVIKIFEVVYQYLSNHGQVDELMELPVILDVRHKLVLKAECVVIYLTREEEIKGHIHQAPLDFGKYFPLFKKLGVSEQVTANHYALILSRLKRAAGVTKLHVEEMKLVKASIEGLFRLLKSSDMVLRSLVIPEVYLPSEGYLLLKSTDLIFIDTYSIWSRLRNLKTKMNFFLGFKELEIPVSTERDEVKFLPPAHQMPWLSQIVNEEIPEYVKQRATKGAYSRSFEEMLADSTFFHVVTRMLYHQKEEHGHGTDPFSEEDAEKIRLCLSRITVRQVQGLETILKWENQLVEGSEQTKPSFVEKRDIGFRNCTVYVDENGSARKVLRSLETAIRYVLCVPFDSSHLLTALRNPEEALADMNEEGIAECDFRTPKDRYKSAFPLAGTFIPIDQHCYLDNNFYEFYKGEHVGFELYDPQIDSEEGDESHAVYIYAIVREKLGEEHTPLFGRHYLIDLGVDRGTAEVSVTKLYKLMRKRERSTPGALVKYEGQETNSNYEGQETNSHCEGQETNSENVVRLDMKEVLKDIRRVLTEAWQQLSDEKERNRVVKRLLLKWHPDKNKGNEDFCTKVCQTLQHYVELLKQGERLPDDDDADDVDGSFSRSAGPSSHTFHARSPFFENMFQRGRAYSRSYEAGSSHRQRSRQRNDWSSTGGPSWSGFQNTSREPTANPQPGEGRRWFRQAEADLSAAQAARRSYARGYNWVCYQCHQAVEKALKAVLYTRDAGSCLFQSHDIGSLARLVNDTELRHLAADLEARVGTHMRMRYPDVLAYPRTPEDVYSLEDAKFACDVASHVVDRVKCLL